jgi:hypothetical protein
MIKKPSDIINADKKIRLLLAGYPGIGKTTLGLSAPKPLLIDVDRGIDRAAAEHRSDYIQPQKYEELLADLTPANLKDYETLVFDTGGQLLKLAGDYVKRQNTAYGQRDGSLSLKGYGAVAREFESLMNKAYYELNKHIIVIFHAKEEKEGDIFKLRLLVEGSTKDNVWQPMDLGGFIEKQNNKTIIEFCNTERHFGKCCHGISPSHEIPALAGNAPNDFLTKLFGQVNENIKKDAEFAENQKQAYRAVMTEITGIIESMKDAGTAQAAGEELKNIEHKLTSQKEAQILFKGKLDKLNLKYDKGTGEYVDKSAGEQQKVSDDAQPA